MQYSYKVPKIFAPVLDWKKRYVALTGGRSSGKSWFYAQYFLDKLLDEKADLLCAREHQNSITESNYKLFCNIINRCNLPYEIQSTKIISKLTGSKIVFVGLSDITADNIKSYEDFKYVWLEEAQKISAKSWEILNPTIRKENSQIFLSMNPEVSHSKHPIMSELLTIFKDETLHIHANYTDNPFCTDDVIRIAEQLKIHKPDDYKYIWLGIPPEESQNTVVKHFTKDNIKECNHIKTLDLHLTCDFNVDPMMWLVAHKTEDKVFFIDEIVIENTSTREAIQEFISRYGNHEGRIIVNGDASGDYRSCQSERSNYIIIKNELEHHFKKHIKIDIKKHNPPIIERIQAFNEMVLNATGQRNIIVSPKCEKFIYNIENLKFKPGTSQIDAPTFAQIKQDKQTKFLGHIFDAGSYLIDYYFPIRRKQDAKY